jgi:hypothetical protein
LNELNAAAQVAECPGQFLLFHALLDLLARPGLLQTALQVAARSILLDEQRAEILFARLELCLLLLRLVERRRASRA